MVEWNNIISTLTLLCCVSNTQKKYCFLGKAMNQNYMKLVKFDDVETYWNY